MIVIATIVRMPMETILLVIIRLDSFNNNFWFIIFNKQPLIDSLTIMGQKI